MRNSRLDNCIAFIGRKTSGKATLIEQLIDELTQRKVAVSLLEQQGNDDNGTPPLHRDSAALATAVCKAQHFTLTEDHRYEDDAASQCLRSIGMLPASNLVIVDGLERTSLPTVEVFCEADRRDAEDAKRVIDALNNIAFDPYPLPDAIVSDIPEVVSAGLCAGIPSFSLYEIAQITTWLIDTYSQPLLSVVIQNGNESKRQHESISLLAPFQGSPLIEYLINRLAPLAAELIVVTKEPEKLAYLQVRYPGVRLVLDKNDKHGALPSFAAALEAATNPLVAAIAYDMTDISVELLEHETMLLEQSQRTDLFMPFDAVMPLRPQGAEPFCAVYERERCLEAARACLDRKKVRMNNMIDTLNVRFIDAKDEALYAGK